MAGVNTDVVASGSVKGGRLYFHNRRAFDEQVRQFRDGAQVEIAVTIRRANRSQQQNGWYWSVIVQLIAEHTGYTPDEVHEFLKAKFIPKRLAIANGNGEVVDEYVLGGSTRKLNTLEFSAYCEAVQQWAAATLDCYIPDPDERGYGAGV
jgi:hypothetical protein